MAGKLIKPYMPAPYKAEDIRAIQALVRGDATEHQQQHAFKYIVEVVSGAYDMPYYDSDRDTAFACGRQYVGKQLVKLLKLLPDKIKD